MQFITLGPFKISEVINPVAFRLALPNTLKIHDVFHVSLLEPKTHDVIANFTQPPPPPIVIDDHVEWEVESILDSRLLYGNLQYFVHWKDYPESDRSWEPLENLENCPDC